MKSYGDAVVFVQKQGDGSTWRVHAIVLASSLHGRLTLDRQPLPDSEPVEHVDLAFPVMSLVPGGQAPKTRDMAEIFRPAYDVAPWVEGAWTGYVEAFPIADYPAVSTQAVQNAVELAAETADLEAAHAGLPSAADLEVAATEPAGGEVVEVVADETAPAAPVEEIGWTPPQE